MRSVCSPSLKGDSSFFTCVIVDAPIAVRMSMTCFKTRSGETLEIAVSKVNAWLRKATSDASATHCTTAVMSTFTVSRSIFMFQPTKQEVGQTIRAHSLELTVALTLTTLISVNTIKQKRCNTLYLQPSRR